MSINPSALPSARLSAAAYTSVRPAASMRTPALSRLLRTATNQGFMLTVLDNSNNSHPYQADMARRNDQHFPYGGPLPNMGTQQGHHATAVQPPMNVPQQSSGPAPPQQKTPTQAPAQPTRNRKRPASAAAPQPVSTAAPSTPVTPAQAAPPSAGAPATPVTPASATPSQPGAPSGEDNGASNAMAPPPAKKSRTNTPWTALEEQRLKQMRDAGSSWAEIAKASPFCSLPSNTDPSANA